MAENVEPEPKKRREGNVSYLQGLRPNTEKNTDWGVTVFNDWKSCRNRESEALTIYSSATKLNFWLSRFVAEVRLSDGKPYPPKSIHQLILRYMRSDYTL